MMMFNVLLVSLCLIHLFNIHGVFCVKHYVFVHISGRQSKQEIYIKKFYLIFVGEGSLVNSRL
jgi:hypothetical protein